MWYVMDAMEIIMGPYETEANAQSDFDLNVEELYFLDDYPNAYIDYIEEDYFNIEDFEYELYKWAEDSILPTREKKVKLRREWK
jgi:hypothetical protein